MSTLTFEKIKMPAGNLGKEGNYPVLYFPLIKGKKKILMGESENLLLGYGVQDHCLPFATQGDYDRSEELREFDVFTLENESLKAVFFPSLGGRMWSLYDKKRGKELVVNNPIFKPCNIAARNAWFAGGVEWNCGFPSHHPLSCDKVYGAMYEAEDGMPILRLYAFERVRAVTYQMDFFLPDGSDALFARMRIVNGSEKVIPIYWWSNIAVHQKKGARVIAPAKEVYINHGFDAPVLKGKLPDHAGFDVSYPTNHIESNDDFFIIPEDTRKFEAYIDAEGYGLIHSSTRRLKGRKMFVWGTSEGGENWQKHLTNEDLPYLEIQGGLGYTQQACEPFPPHGAFEWLEAYSAIEMDPTAVHGAYEDAVDNVMQWLDTVLPESRLDDLLRDTKKEALRDVPYTYKGHPWGTLDNELKKAMGQRLISPNLQFGEMEEPQGLWLRFLQNGKLEEPDPKDPPASFMVQDEWYHMLKKTVRKADKDNWFAWYHLGLCYYAREEYELSQEMMERSISLNPSTWAYHGLACALLRQDERELGAEALVKAVELNPSDRMLAKESVKICDHFGQYEATRKIYDAVDETCKQDPYVLGYYAAALAYTGDEDYAKEILERDGGLYILDIREGDEVITNAYIHIIQEMERRAGRQIAAKDVKVPANIDFRMFNDLKKK